MDIIEKALLVASTAHAAVGQVRKYTNDPYIVHPIAVMQIVETVDHTPDMLAAALLHDIVEDTEISLHYISEKFSPKIAEYVIGLTEISLPTDGNRAIRKAMDRAFLSIQPPEVQTIKYADIIDNTSDIEKHDAKFATLYFEEKRQLMAIMDKGDKILYNRVMKIIQQ